MIALIASFFSLFVGPLVYQTFGPMRRTDKLTSGFIIAIISGIILLEVLPDNYRQIGWIAVALSLIGFAGPTIIERSFRRAADKTHKLTIYLGLFGLLLHAMIDGAALQVEQGNLSKSLNLAIVLHRLPVGLTIWWLLRPILGERVALTMLFFMGLATLAGYFLSHVVGKYDDVAAFALVQSLVAGSLLHVVIYKPHSDGCLHTSHTHDHHQQAHTEDSKTLRQRLLTWEVLGFVIGAIVLSLIDFQH